MARKPKEATKARGKAKDTAAPAKRGRKSKAATAGATADTTEQGTTKVHLVDRSKYKYPRHPDARTASNRAAIDNGDPVAEALRGKTVEESLAILLASGGAEGETWARLNSGLQRMAIGNSLRKLWRVNGRIKVGNRWVTNPDYVAPEPTEEKTSRRKAA